MLITSALTGALARRAAIRVPAGFLFCLILTLIIKLYYFNELRYGDAAKRGNVTALRNLGQSMMHYHQGARCDPARGEAFLTKAAEAGDVGAQVILACRILRYYPETNRTMATYWLGKAASSNDPEAALLLKALESPGFSLFDTNTDYYPTLEYAHGKRWDK